MTTELQQPSRSPLDDAPISTVSLTGGGRSMLWAPAVVAIAVIAATGYVATVDPNVPGHYAVCPLKAATGLDCPFCGGLRSVHALTDGDLGTALDQNILVVLVVLPLAIGMWIVWVVRLWRGAPPFQPRATRFRRLLPYAFLVGMLVFAVVRNLPFVPYLKSGIG